MKQSILVTGIAGSGKSTLSKHLRELGYASYEIETIPHLLITLDTQTNKPFEHYNQHDAKQVVRARWKCDIDKLAEIIEKEPDDIAFYCGTCSNIHDTLHLFTKVFVLSASHDVIRHRLTHRTSHDFGKEKDVQDWLLSWKDDWEKYMEGEGATLLNADATTEDTAQEILRIIQVK